MKQETLSVDPLGQGLLILSHLHEIEESSFLAIKSAEAS